MARSRASSNGGSSESFVCPECGREFTRAAALGAHRSRAHGVAGSSRSASAAAAKTRSGSKRKATARRRDGARPASAPTTTGTATVAAGATPAPATTRTRGRRSTPRSNGSDRRTAARATRERVLKALFPRGLPPNEALLAAIGPWLDEADRIARMR
jgi:hypothetical protein